MKQLGNGEVRLSRTERKLFGAPGRVVPISELNVDDAMTALAQEEALLRSREGRLAGAGPEHSLVAFWHERRVQAMSGALLELVGANAPGVDENGS